MTQDVKIVHYQIADETVEEHAASHGLTIEKMGNRPCSNVGGESTEDERLVTCEDCIGAGFGGERE